MKAINFSWSAFVLDKEASVSIVSTTMKFLTEVYEIPSRFLFLLREDQADAALTN